MPFIVFEGLDHSGKSTLVKSTAMELKNKEVDFVLTREPGGTPIGEKIREILLKPYGEPLSAETEVLLISASRKDHLEKVILPALDKGQWVICDRFWASTSAYQGKGRGLPDDTMEFLNRLVVSGAEPDLWILLDLPVVEKEKRVQFHGQPADRFEIMDRNFHQRVRECYLKMAKDRPESWLVLNALLQPQELVQKVLQELYKRKWLKEKAGG